MLPDLLPNVDVEVVDEHLDGLVLAVLLHFHALEHALMELVSFEELLLSQNEQILVLIHLDGVVLDELIVDDLFFAVEMG